MSNLRFAILCRVSTIRQEKDGISLDIQMSTLRRCVEVLGGVLEKEYVGQEHSTEGFERPILDQILSDAKQNLFDALMVYDQSRLTRDPIRSKIILAELKKHNISFFVQTQQYDMNNPETKLIMGMLSEINAFHADIQTRKAMASRIELAKRGWPLSRLPFGRRPKHNNKNLNCEWEIIPEKKELVDTIYDLYVNQNLSFKKIAEKLNIAQTFISKILFTLSKDVWTQELRYDGRNETILVEVPALLTNEQIETAKNISRNNQKFNARKHNCLLSGKIKCGICKSTFIGSTHFRNGKNQTHYVHATNFRTDVCIKSIKSELVEAAVIRTMSDLFLSTQNLKKAIENALVITKNQKENLEIKIAEIKKELSQLEKQKSRLVDAVMKGIFEDDDISEEMNKIRKNTIEKQTNLKICQNNLKTITIEVPDDLHLRIQKYYKQLCGSEDESIIDWSFEKQKRLIDWFFGIGKKQGVFILKHQDGLSFKIAGCLNSSIFGVIEDKNFYSGVVGIEELETSLDGSGAVDFRRIIEDLSVDTNTTLSRKQCSRLDINLVCHVVIEYRKFKHTKTINILLNE